MTEREQEIQQRLAHRKEGTAGAIDDLPYLNAQHEADGQAIKYLLARTERLENTLLNIRSMPEFRGQTFIDIALTWEPKP